MWDVTAKRNASRIVNIKEGGTRVGEERLIVKGFGCAGSRNVRDVL